MTETLFYEPNFKNRHSQSETAPQGAVTALGKSKDGNQTGGREAYMRNQKNNNGSGSFKE